MNVVLPLYKNINELNEYLTPFPNIDEIFVQRQSWLIKHFLPLVSGQVVHMLNPFGPYEGYIGEHTKKHHNKFVSANWLSFRLTYDNKYEFLADERYFARSLNTQLTDVFDNSIDDKDFDDVQTYVEESIEYYQFRQKCFYQIGKLLSVYPGDDDGAVAQNWPDSTGGKLSENVKDWLSDCELPAAFVCQWQDDEPVIAYNDKAFYFIAGVPAYRYGCHGADWIILLYEPVSQIVLFTYGYL